MKLINAPLPVALLMVFLFLSCLKNDSTNPITAVDNAKLDEAFSQAKQITSLKSLVVSYNGKIIKEAFYNDGSAVAANDVMSVTKSVVGLLIGIATDKGSIKSIDQPIGDYISSLVENLSTEKTNIKIRHLLTMSSGFEWEELVYVSGFNNWITSANQVQYLTDKPLTSQAGEVFTYNSAALHLLSVIISRASGMKTLDFAKLYLFDSLGISNSN
ncbi:MAG: serine hydrolase [Ignavibacteria bacterium]|nr:serine hydrolase [Ignavibacteria bacterium]